MSSVPEGEIREEWHFGRRVDVIWVLWILQIRFKSEKVIQNQSLLYFCPLMAKNDRKSPPTLSSGWASLLKKLPAYVIIFEVFYTFYS